MLAMFQVSHFTRNVNWAFDGFSLEIRNGRGHLNAWKVRFSELAPSEHLLFSQGDKSLLALINTTGIHSLY